MPTLEVGHGAVGYGDGGRPWSAGRPMAVLVHGAGGDRSTWPLQARALARAGWNVLAVDLPGHGGSDPLGSEVTIEGLASWLQNVLKAVPEQLRKRIDLAGHSMGACIAATYAATAALKPEHLALLGAGAAMPVNDALLDDTLHHQQRAANFISAFGHGRAHHLGRAQVPGVWALGATRAQILRTQPTILHADFAACGAWDSSDILPKISCPALVLIGAQDRMTPPRAGHQLAKLIPSASAETLSEVGHMMMLEAPREVSNALLAHFSCPTAADPPVPQGQKL